MPEFHIGSRAIGDGHPTWFVADISANHDGDLERAKALIHLAAENGADAAKFQNFRAAKIVSAEGFAAIGSKLSHQSRWKQSVFEVYQAASLPWEWTPVLHAECERAGIEFCSTPYDLEAVDMLDPYQRLFKIGSGDITWPEMLRAIAAKGKPVLLATGASELGEVQRAAGWIRESNPPLCLMQCNTNYTGSPENVGHTHLRVLTSFRATFPDAVLGLSDHSSSLAPILGAVALGARVVERHFTDDTRRSGPDHAFSMRPAAWREMVERTRELEAALGSPEKRVADNERETVVVQRRSLRAARNLAPGEVLTARDIEPLRPATPGCLAPYDAPLVIGMRVAAPIAKGEGLRANQFQENRAGAV